MYPSTSDATDKAKGYLVRNLVSSFDSLFTCYNLQPDNITI